MKLSAQKLKQIIKEELKRVLNENYTFEWNPEMEAVIATGSSYADREYSFSPEEFIKATPSEYVDGHREIEVDGGPGTIEISNDEFKTIVNQLKMKTS
tara:strand:- start:1452 stop:1745 length:294 start_codon:yes stop_codon:yes gene_type:complete